MTHHDPDDSDIPSPPSTFTIQESQVDGVVVLSVGDALDLMTAPRLSAEVNARLAKSPAGLIIDLTEVTFLASAGMTALVRAQEQAGSAVRFGIVADGPATSRPIKLLGLDDALPMYPTLDDALRHLR